MQAWEYKQVSSMKCEEVVNKLHTLGEEGWELVSMFYDKVSYIAILKRPKQKAAKGRY